MQYMLCSVLAPAGDEPRPNAVARGVAEAVAAHAANATDAAHATNPTDSVDTGNAGTRHATRLTEAQQGRRPPRHTVAEVASPQAIKTRYDPAFAYMGIEAVGVKVRARYSRSRA